MSNDIIALELKERVVKRKGLGPLRSEGTVPAVIHNHGKESLMVQGEYQTLVKVFQQAGRHHPVQLQVGGKRHLALIKSVDYEPRKHRIRHIVFQAIKQNEKTTAQIPVALQGEEIPAEKKGLLILTQLDTVEVSALPKNLPNQLTVDATALENEGDRLHVSDIQAPEGVEILTAEDTTIAVVEMPRDQVAEADAAAAAIAEGADKPSEESETAEADSNASDKN